ncbi:MAG: hypothetical protein COY50_04920 [Deltaproteobacteria bacterium CG_4_10_14_0_8_um_filter_43_12]|nr:MAG: hypothetical protein COY50_04920 [Deltaproteobacteria bacterium CG_4_10_14_0_8_um_filter_43_12]
MVGCSTAAGGAPGMDGFSGEKGTKIGSGSLTPVYSATFNGLTGGKSAGFSSFGRSGSGTGGRREVEIILRFWLNK